MHARADAREGERREEGRHMKERPGQNEKKRPKKKPTADRKREKSRGKKRRDEGAHAIESESANKA